MPRHRRVEGPAAVGRFKRRLLSCFIAFNLCTALYMNRPNAVVEAEEGWFRSLSPGLAYELRYSRWALQYYAFLIGLNNKWQMFGDLSRYYWWYSIKARYGEGEAQVLPLPLQSKRGFWDRALFDFKETKLLHTLYARPQAREAYAYYLARQYPERDGVPISAVVIELSWRQILPREEAARRGTHLDSVITTQVLQKVEYQDR
ncbi:MAG: hypothetical protein FJY95_11280 [Candidatus Handelsmanbacteria bacterium]|nr:hypothetical protein [Candidatus Handelsmanbacteria bacterium]